MLGIIIWPLKKEVRSMIKTYTDIAAMVRTDLKESNHLNDKADALVFIKQRAGYYLKQYSIPTITGITRIVQMVTRSEQW